MQIALCVKEVLDATGPLGLIEDVESLDSAGLVPIVNPADLVALALMIKSLPAGAAEITAITVGPRSAERALRSCVAIGASKAVRVWDKALEEGQSGIDVTARVLASTISTLGFDLVVCGAKGLCGASGYVGPALAEYLNFAQVSGVSHVELSEGKDALTMHRRLDHGDREIVACQLPAVITVDEGTVDVPYASLPNLLASARIPVQVLDLAAIGLKSAAARSNSSVRFMKYIQPRPRTKKTPTLDASLTPMQMMQQISGGGAKKSSGPVEGDAKKVAAEIISFLVSNGLLAKETGGSTHQSK